MTISTIATWKEASGATSVTLSKLLDGTTNIDTTGMTLLVLVAAHYYSDTALNDPAVPVSDNKSNTWHPAYSDVMTGGDLNQRRQRMWYAYGSGSGPSVGSGHTFTFGTLSQSEYPNLILFACNGTVIASDPLDKAGADTSQESAGTTVHTSLATATTTEANEVLVGAYCDLVNHDGALSVTGGQGWSGACSTNVSSASTIAGVEWKEVSSTGTYQASFTTTTGCVGYPAIATFKLTGTSNVTVSINTGIASTSAQTAGTPGISVQL